MPKISVVMGCYNHAAYVAQAIESVLAQSFADFEFLIADDGSPDHTKEVVAKFNDPRITFFPHADNRGACVVLNELITRATGDYVAVMNSDDYWPADKLAYQLDFLETHPDHAAIFGRPAFVDRQGQALEEKAQRAIFDQPNRKPGQWLRYFFERGNCLCHPTILIRRSCYDVIGLFDNRLRQLPDFDMWLRLCKRFKFHVSDKVLVYFRILPGENASGITPQNSMRIMNEQALIADKFFDGVSPHLLREGFADMLVRPDLPGEMHLEIEKTLLYFMPNKVSGRAYLLAGLRKLYGLLGDESYRLILERDYRLNDRSFHKLMAQGDLSAFPGSMIVTELKKRLIGKIKNSVLGIRGRA